MLYKCSYNRLQSNHLSSVVCPGWVHVVFLTELSSLQYLKKLHTQERAVEEVKLAIKPYYQRKDINKDEYKDILRKAVHKVSCSRPPPNYPQQRAEMSPKSTWAHTERHLWSTWRRAFHPRIATVWLFEQITLELTTLESLQHLF